MILHEQGFIPIGEPGGGRGAVQGGIFVLYPLIPWVGVMAVGYSFGRVMRMPPARRARWCAGLGVACIAAFITLRIGGLYGDPAPAAPGDRPVLQVLNTTKYPPSLQFLLMTLGPALLGLPALDWLLGRPWGARVLEPMRTIGRVPLFFYLLHIPLIHASSAILWYAVHGAATGWQIDPASWPAGYTPRLWVAYVAWIGVLLALWAPCRWFAALRRRRGDWWLSYL
jgi:uncharacterized membrane protein